MKHKLYGVTEELKKKALERPLDFEIGGATMNKMKDIAKLLGVELYEEFAIEEEYGTRFRLTNIGLQISYSDENWIYCNRIFDLLTGVNTIRKLPWKPKFGTIYYVPITQYSKYNTYTFSNDVVDKFYMDNKLMCETKEEAIKLRNYILEQVKKYREEQKQ